MTEYPYKQAFREACRSRGINPVEGANSFQVVEYLTCEAKRTHYARCEAQVYEHAERHPLNYATGYLEADEVVVADRASRSWWQSARMWTPNVRADLIRYQDSFYERIVLSGQQPEPTETAAVRNVREEAKVLEAVRLRRIQAERWRVYRALVKEVLIEARQSVEYSQLPT